MNRPPLAILVAGAIAFCAPAFAAGPTAPLGAGWVAVDPALLDELRGGFMTGDGMALSFGIERAVFVNGELLATTRVQIPDVARMSSEQAQALADFNQGMVVQVGSGNTFERAGNLNGILIQNTLDGQDIRAMTTVDVGVDTLSAFQDLNTQSALHNAMVTATSP
ncbi:MAG TPA: hypothetical protein VGD42_01200 [Lysobacter sp.]